MTELVCRRAVLVILFLMIVSAAEHAVSETWQDAIQIPPGDSVRDVLTADLTDVECLALNVYHEARGEGQLGMELVAQVTVNRIRSRWFPETACAVVREINRDSETGRLVAQFSWVLDGRADYARDDEGWARSYLIAVRYLMTGVTAPVAGADRWLHYHAITVNPGWDYVRRVYEYRRHVFYIRCAC